MGNNNNNGIRNLQFKFLDEVRSLKDIEPQKTRIEVHLLDPPGPMEGLVTSNPQDVENPQERYVFVVINDTGETFPLHI